MRTFINDIAKRYAQRTLSWLSPLSFSLAKNSGIQMNKKFYLELSEMAGEAIQKLDQFEISSNGDPKIFDKIRAVGVPCMDGQKINQSIKDDLPIRDHLEFERAIMSIFKLTTLSGGKGANKILSNYLAYIQSKAYELSSGTNNNLHLKVFYSWQASRPNKTNRGCNRSPTPPKKLAIT